MTDPLITLRADLDAEIQRLDHSGPGPRPTDIARHVYSARLAEMRRIRRQVEDLIRDPETLYEIEQRYEFHRAETDRYRDLLVQRNKAALARIAMEAGWEK